MGAWVLALGAGPIGHLQVGALAGAIGAGLTLSVNGGVMIALALVAAAAAPVRKCEDEACQIYWSSRRQKTSTTERSMIKRRSSSV